MRTLLGAALFLNSFVVVAQTCQPLQEYDEITSIVTEQFYDKTYNGLDWDARISSYRDEIDCGGHESEARAAS